MTQRPGWYSTGNALKRSGWSCRQPGERYQLCGKPRQVTAPCWYSATEPPGRKLNAIRLDCRSGTSSTAHDCPEFKGSATQYEGFNRWFRITVGMAYYILRGSLRHSTEIYMLYAQLFCSSILTVLRTDDPFVSEGGVRHTNVPPCPIIWFLAPATASHILRATTFI